MTKDQYGSAIKHLEPHHIASIPVPLLAEPAMDEIANSIRQAYSLREEANALLDVAFEEMYGDLGLPAFDDTLVDYLPSPSFSSQLPVDSRQIRAFAVGTTELDDRLDASYHLPITKSAIAVMTSGHFPLLPISEMCEDIKLPGRFKRVYVNKEYGIPFIQGSHIPLMKPYNLKYLARRHYRSLDQWKVSPGWVLVTCSGTIGRVSMVPSGEEGFAASQHLIRIIAKRPDYNPGYLALFLMTPYGQHQMLSKIYGAVVDELTASDLAHVMVPDAPSHIQDSIGEKVLKAFETKEQANFIENNAVREFEARLGQQ